MSNLDARLRVMDLFSGYQQVLSLSSPTVEAFGPVDVPTTLAKAGNDALAKLVDQFPERFPGFIASLPMSSPGAAIREAERAVQQLGAMGVQIYTSVNGHPIDQPEILEVFGRMVELGRPVWLHPIRPMNAPDYPTEDYSKFDLWWAFGWPHETSIAMGRLVFAGLFDRWPDLTVITHHAGGTVPMFEGRIKHGLSLLGSRNTPEMAAMVATDLVEQPLSAFRRFYVDTATFGSRGALECARDFFGIDKMLFASDMPFDPEQGAGFIRETLRSIQEMDLTAKERSAILKDNFETLMKRKSQICQ